MIYISVVIVFTVLICMQPDGGMVKAHVGECFEDDEDLFDLDENVTEHFAAFLKINSAPPFHSDETHALLVMVAGRSEEYPNNTTARVLLGLDGLESPECTSAHSYLGIIQGHDTDYEFTYWAVLNITLMQNSSLLLGQATVGNLTLNLSYDLSVLPPRVHLTARIDLPLEDQDWYEQEWVAVPVVIENVGGAAGTNLVVDFIYDGRIAATEYINLIPPHGNVTVTIALYITNSGWKLVVNLVQGPDAPLEIADFIIIYWPRPILDVVSIKVDPTSIESGSKVHIEAVVTNRGNATSDGQLVELMVDGTVVANASIVGLEPGNETVVSTNWTLSGVGIHTVSALAEGDEFAAEPVAVNVKEKTPAPGLGLSLMAILCALVVTRAVRRSR